MKIFSVVKVNLLESRKLPTVKGSEWGRGQGWEILFVHQMS